VTGVEAMDLITLQNPTGLPAIDEVCRGVVGIFETAFPERICGYYIEGSYADHTAVAASDVDLTIVFQDAWLSEEENDRAGRLAAYVADMTSIEIDIELVDQQSLRVGAKPTLKLGAQLLYGDDVRDDVPLMPIHEWTRQRMHAAYWLMINVFGRAVPVRLPLDYPDPKDEFYGYTRRLIQLPDGREVPSTRDLIRVTGWAATALMALQAHRYVVRKRDCFLAYEQYINDEWSPLLNELYRTCRSRWNYLLPERDEDRQYLREMCERTLDFENYFMSVYTAFVITELRSHDAHAEQAALRILGNTPLVEARVASALRRLASTSSGDVGEASAAILDKTSNWPS